MFVQGMKMRKKAGLCTVVGKPKAGREGLPDGKTTEKEQRCSERAGLDILEL